MWLYKYGITDQDIKRYRFGFSEWYDRLIMPVFNDGKLVYWQGRNLGKSTKDSPKYTNVKSNRSSVYFQLLTYPGKPVVLVEDILSAIRVNNAGYNSVALLGTNIGTYLVKELQQLRPTLVLVWLDPDKRLDCVKYACRLTALGVPTQPVITCDRDPKEYSQQEIKDLIGGRYD